jgi:hypothetical protein
LMNWRDNRTKTPERSTVTSTIVSPVTPSPPPPSPAPGPTPGALPPLATFDPSSDPPRTLR